MILINFIFLHIFLGQTISFPLACAFHDKNEAFSLNLCRLCKLIISNS